MRIINFVIIVHNSVPGIHVFQKQPIPRPQETSLKKMYIKTKPSMTGFRMDF